MPENDKNQTGGEIAHGAIITEKRRNVLSDGHRADCIILKWLNRYAKPTIAWRNELDQDVAWLMAHEYLDEALTILHKHIGIETSDSTGQLQTRFGIGYGADTVDIQVRSVANFDMLDAIFKLRSSGTATQNISRFANTNFANLNFQTNEVDKWALQMRNTGNDFIFLRDTANGVNTFKAKPLTGELIQRARNSAPTDGDLDNGSIVFYLNEAGNLLTIRAKYSDGTLKSGTVALA